MYDFLSENVSYNNLNKFQKAKVKWLESKEEYSKATKITYWILLNKNICNLEKFVNKDLYDFTNEEISKVLVEIDNIKTMIILKSIISSYMNNKSLKNVVVESKVNYQPLNEFYEMLEKLKCSDVDKMLLVLARYGVDTSKIINIRWNQINKNNMTLNLDENIKLPIDNKFIDYLNKAHNCNSYEYKTSTLNYVDKGYIIKVSNKTELDTLNRDSLYTRVNSLSKNNGIAKISLRELNSYRQYDLLFDVLNDKGVVTYDDIRNVLIIIYGSYTKNKAQYLKERFEIISQ